MGKRGMLDDLATVKSEINAQVRGEGTEGGNDEDIILPHSTIATEGHIETKPESTTNAEVPKEEAAPAKAAAEPAEESIIIGDREFKTHKEAIEYAKQLDDEKMKAELYAQGVRDALQSRQPVEAAQTPAEPAPIVTEEEFYSNPTEALRKVAQTAKDEAKAELRKEDEQRSRAEGMWNTFLTEYPDIDRVDAERILQQNWNTIGKMTDVKLAMKQLAQKTRAEYQRIVERMKPRSEVLQARSAQVVSTGLHGGSGVTPAPKQEKVLTMTEQLKSMRRR